MTKLSFYNGLREIGGTFVVVETDYTRCMFDFGFAVAGRSDERIRKRKGYAADYIRTGMLTAVDGIYDETTAHKLGLKTYEEMDKKTFLVISHMHIDHMGGLGSISQQVPVYMSMDSLRLYHKLAENEDIQDAVHKNCIGIPYGDSFTVGDITVKILAVDHDIIGASGFLITTPDGKICYTGDYRFHGFHPEITRNFAREVKGADVMITEGVSVSFDDIDMLSMTKPTEPIRTEEDLQQEMKELAEAEKELIVINPYNRNVERLYRLKQTLESVHRILVLDSVSASYVSEFFTEDAIYVYEETLHTDIKQIAHLHWNMITREELLDNPERYVLQLDYSDIYELLDIKDKTACYVHMDGAPLGEYDASFAKMKDLLKYLQIRYIHMGVGGHASPWYLKEMIDTIEPATLIPLHSFRPEQVQSEKAGRQYLPEYGDSFVL